MARVTRRQFISYGMGGIAGAYLSSRSRFLGAGEARAAVTAVQGAPLGANKIRQFVDPLPDLGAGLHVIDGAAPGQIVLSMEEYASKVMPTGFKPAVGTYNGTYVWRYFQTGQTADSYIGPVVLARRGTPTEIKFVNNLGTAGGTKIAAWSTSTDQTLHWADPLGLHHMMPDAMANYDGPVPAVPHLHGGEVPPQLDGGPDAWFTSDGLKKGAGYYSGDGPDATNYAIYRYPNTQEHANIWFHDHALGITRLNVYAGLAGAYLLDDPTAWKPGAAKPPVIPLVIQDRMFDTNGQLYFPNLGINPEHPFWVPEFVGDTIVVNGKVWPYKDVERKRYSLWFLNGSNARAYDMYLIDPVTGVKGPKMYVITTDGGYLDTPALVDPNGTRDVGKSLVVMPGERYEVIVDFNDAAWTAAITKAYAALGMPVPPVLNLLLRNTARTPFPGGAPAPQSTTGRVMQFRVKWASGGADSTFDPAGGAALRNRPIVRLVTPATGTVTAPAATALTVKRQLTLNEVMGPGGPLEVLVNNTKWNGLSSATDTYPGGVRPDFTPGPGGNNYISENPVEGAVELWEIINLTADAHPIHLHLVQFQLLNRQAFDAVGYQAAYDMAFNGSNAAVNPMTGLPGIPPGMFIPAYGPPGVYGTVNGDGAVGGNPAVGPFLAVKKGVQLTRPPLAYEAGWKDTVIMYPGEVTRIMVRWAPTDAPLDGTAYSFPFDPSGAGAFGYVWHCHIIDHEDNEMMRPDMVAATGATRTYNQGPDF